MQILIKLLLFSHYSQCTNFTFPSRSLVFSLLLSSLLFSKLLFVVLLFASHNEKEFSFAIYSFFAVQRLWKTKWKWSKNSIWTAADKSRKNGMKVQLHFIVTTSFSFLSVSTLVVSEVFFSIRIVDIVHSGNDLKPNKQPSLLANDENWKKHTQKYKKWCCLRNQFSVFTEKFNEWNNCKRNSSIRMAASWRLKSEKWKSFPLFFYHFFGIVNY